MTIIEHQRLLTAEQETNAVNETMSKAAEPVLRHSSMMVDMTGSLASEMLRFTSQRLKAHAEHLQALAECRSMQAVLEQQMAFMRNSAAEFASGTSNLLHAAQPKSTGQYPG